MIVELCGLPGVGKTSLAKIIELQHGLSIVVLSGKVEILYYVLKGFILHPNLFSKGLWWCLCNNFTFYYTWNFFFVRYAKLQRAFDLKSQGVILDEGPLTNIISYSDTLHNDIDLKYFRSYIKKIDRIVCISISEQERQAQIIKRDGGKTNRRKQSSEGREQNMQPNNLQLQALCGLHSGGQVIDSYNDLPDSYFNY